MVENWFKIFVPHPGLIENKGTQISMIRKVYIFLICKVYNYKQVIKNLNPSRTLKNWKNDFNILFLAN